MMILVDENGRPFEKPAPPESGATTDAFIAWMRDLYAYHDAIADCANREFTDQFRKSMRDERKGHA